MGRRALPKIDPAVDLSRHLMELDTWTVPFAASDVFGRVAPLEIEVGSGKGLFLLSASARSPDRDFLGIELARKYSRFAAARLAKANRTNARVIHGDGQKLFREYLRSDTAAAVHVYFPDPWWKQRHMKRRLLNEDFLRQVERVLQPGGHFHVWTDVEDYFESTLALIAAVTRFGGPLEVVEQAPEHDLDYRTHFERRVRLIEQPIYRAEFVAARDGL